MNDPRRYDEREIALIFERSSEAAAERSMTSESSAGGLTLAQLHEIGREVGLSPESITSAAQAVGRGDLVPTAERRWLGLPVGVFRTIEFDRPVTDEQWNRLVVTLRETFEARGRLVTEGPFRHWQNGNLQALLEPTATGHRLRLTTRKGSVRPRLLAGSVYVALGALWAALGATGAVSARGGTLGAGLLAAAGVFMLGSAVAGLPRWARLRARQMEEVAERSAVILQSGE